METFYASNAKAEKKYKIVRKLYTSISVIVAGLIPCLLIGCGHVESAKTLYRQAVENYGECDLIEKDTHGWRGKDAYTKIVCRDEEDGFTYTVKSYMYENNLDGASLGYLPITVSDFESVYAGFIYESVKDEITNIEQETGTKYEVWDDWLIDNYGSSQEPFQPITVYGVVKAHDSSSAGEAAVAIGDLYREADTRGYFLSDRGSNNVPVIKGKPMEPVSREDSLGELSILDLEWHSIEEQRMESYIEKAWTYDVTAEYVGQHTGVFSDTGADLNDVMHFGEDYPTGMDSPVVFYDFITDEGKEFWITNFTVKPPYGEHKGACSNFE